MPLTSRMAIQLGGLTLTAWIKIAVDASEASAAKTRTWPTLATSFGVRMEPTKKPR